MATIGLHVIWPKCFGQLLQNEPINPKTKIHVGRPTIALSPKKIWDGVMYINLDFDFFAWHNHQFPPHWRSWIHCYDWDLTTPYFPQSPSVVYEICCITTVQTLNYFVTYLPSICHQPPGRRPHNLGDFDQNIMHSRRLEWRPGYELVCFTLIGQVCRNTKQGTYLSMASAKVSHML